MSERTWTEDQLPPVKPPSAGFLVQLFLIPMIIVSIIVLVWLMFSWLAHLGTRPEDLAADLEKMNQGSWQRALTLANMLRDPGNSELRHDEALAKRLADLLDREVKNGNSEVERIQLRMYLCRALGEFEIPAGLDALATAAEPTTHDKAAWDVRRSAVQAIGLLVDRMRTGSSKADSSHSGGVAHALGTVANGNRVMQALRSAGQERTDDPELVQDAASLRATTAFTLGVIGGDEAKELLAVLLLDAHADVRYNAATGLARNGDVRAVPRLVEMLSPVNPEVEKLETDSDNQKWKQLHINKSALQATRRLLAMNPDFDRTEIHAALQTLAAGESAGDLAIELKLTQKLIDVN